MTQGVFCQPAGLASLDLPFHGFALFPLSAAIFIGGLGLFVALVHPRRNLHQVFGLFCGSLATAFFLKAGLYAAPTPEFARQWSLILSPAPLLLPALGFHFALLLSRMKHRIFRGLLLFFYVSGAVLFFLSFFPSLTAPYRWTGQMYAPGILTFRFGLLAALLVLSFSLSLILVAVAYRRTAFPLRINRYKLFFLAATLAGALGGGEHILSLWYDHPPILPFGFVVFAGINAVAIVERRFLDMEKIVKKSAVYISVTGILTIFTTVIMILGSAGAEQDTSAPVIAVNALAVVAIAVLIPPLHARIRAWVDPGFSQRPAGKRTAPGSLSAKIPRAMSRRELVTILLNGAIEILQIRHADVLLAREDGAGYTLAGRQNTGAQAVLTEDGASAPVPFAVLDRLEAAGQALVRPFLRLKHAGDPLPLEQVRSWFKETGAEAAVPILLRNQCQGILLLGPKLSGASLSGDELEFFQICAGQAGVALANSKLHDQALALRARYDNLLRSMSTGFLSIDRSGRIVMANEAGEEILERARGDLPGLRVQAVLAELPEVLALLTETLSAPLERREAVEVKLSGPEGKTVSFSASPLRDGQGGIQGAVLLLSDLTLIKELETQLERSRRLVVLGEMAQGIAHEIKNPLGSIKIFVEALNEHFDDPSYRRRFVSEVLPEIDNLNALVRDLLEYSGPSRLLKSPADLCDLLETSIQACSSLLEAAGMEVYVESRGCPAVALCDGERIKLVFEHVIRNAIDACAGAPVRNLHAGCDLADGQARCRIRDTGVGIPQESLPKLFHPFFTTWSPQTGLGLALSARIVDDHGGSIRISSQPGEGAEVEILLPLDESETPFGRRP